MKVNHIMKGKAKKEIPQEDPIFYTVHSKARLPKSIARKVQEIKRHAHAKRKIPILIIDDREQKMKVTIHPHTRLDGRIDKFKDREIITMAFEHLLICRRRYL